MAHIFTLRCSTCRKDFASAVVESGRNYLYENSMEHVLPCHPIGESTGLEVIVRSTNPFDRICEMFGVNGKPTGTNAVFKIWDGKTNWFISGRA